MEHFGDRTVRCNGCLQDILIPFNQVGGFWHLSGWEGKDGIKIYGGFCSDCFGKMSDEKNKM